MDKKRILIVDDEENFLIVTKLNLEATGKYEVETLTSAENLIPKAYDFKPDLVLLDMLMPGITGIEACADFNKDPALMDIPVIMLTALERKEDKDKAYCAGIKDYLIKPINAEELIDKIEKTLFSE